MLFFNANYAIFTTILLILADGINGQLQFSDVHCDSASVVTYSEKLCLDTGDTTQNTEDCVRDASYYKMALNKAIYWPYHVANENGITITMGPDGTDFDEMGIYVSDLYDKANLAFNTQYIISFEIETSAAGAAVEISPRTEKIGRETTFSGAQDWGKRSSSPAIYDLAVGTQTYEMFFHTGSTFTLAAVGELDEDNLFERLYLEFKGPEGTSINIKSYTLSSCPNKDSSASLCDASHPYATDVDHMIFCCNEANLCGSDEGSCSSDDQCKSGLTCSGSCDFGAGPFTCCTGTVVESCNDGILNQDEEEVDCGGAICGECSTGTLLFECGTGGFYVNANGHLTRQGDCDDNTIFLEEFNIKSIDVDAFFGTTEPIEKIYLTDNLIDTIEIGTFNRLPRLRFLKLEGNNMQEFKEPLDLTSLTFLSMSNNELTHFPTGFPSTMAKIYLQNNKLTGEVKIDSSVLPVINTIFLGGNDISSLDLDLPSLQILDLEKVTNMNIFEQNLNLPGLQTLDAAETIITDFTLISKFPNLITLLMDESSNGVGFPKSIPKGTFTQNAKLENINLAWNALDCCSMQGLTELSRAQTVSITGNCLNEGQGVEYNLTSMLENATTFYTGAQCNLAEGNEYYDEDELVVKSCTAPIACSNYANSCAHSDGGVFPCIACEEGKYDKNGECVGCELRNLCMEPDMEATGTCSLDEPYYYCKVCEEGYYVTESGQCEIVQAGKSVNVNYIIGGAVGGVVLLLIIVAVVVALVIRRQRKNYKKEDYLDGMSPQDFVMDQEKAKIELQTDEEYIALQGGDTNDSKKERKASESFSVSSTYLLPEITGSKVSADTEYVIMNGDLDVGSSEYVAEPTEEKEAVVVPAEYLLLDNIEDQSSKSVAPAPEDNEYSNFNPDQPEESPVVNEPEKPSDIDNEYSNYTHDVKLSVE